MKKTRAMLTLLVTFISAAAVIGNGYQVAAVGQSIGTSQTVYSFWGVGGSVAATALNLTQRTMYYLWLLKPHASIAQMVGSVDAGTGNVASTTFPILPIDPAGTYTLTLSTSGTFDTLQAFAHFGVFGTNAAAYNRTQTVTVAGGGFAVNSTITLNFMNGNRSLSGYPTDTVADANGQFTYNLKLQPNSPLGSLNITVSGRSFDQGLANATRTVTVKPTSISLKTVSSPSGFVERTSPVNMTLLLSYPDNSLVLTGNMSVQVVSQLENSTVPLVIANATYGLWQTVWTPNLAANLTAYRFVLHPSNFTDAYGNLGQGSSIISSSFRVLPAKLALNFTASASYERTQNVTVTVTAGYHNGQLANLTPSVGSVIRSDGTSYKINLSNGTSSVGTSKLPVNATTGSWSMILKVGDRYGNNGTTVLSFQVLNAVPNFTVNSPTTQRTTPMNITALITYPDGSPYLPSGQINLTIAIGNRTWAPKLTFNATTSQWAASLYVVQNATLGQYNITISANDLYNNAGVSQTFTQVIPAYLAIHPNSTQLAVGSYSVLDLPVHVTYPNGTSLTSAAGQVNASYTNSTGTIFTFPLVYNATQGWWDLLFYAPEKGNFAFSFIAADVYGNSGQAVSAFSLSVSTPQAIITRKLMIAAVIGAIIPIVLLGWAIATVSTRRRKHKP